VSGVAAQQRLAGPCGAIPRSEQGRWYSGKDKRIWSVQWANRTVKNLKSLWLAVGGSILLLTNEEKYVKGKFFQKIIE
jgi:hypothetical protein